MIPENRWKHCSHLVYVYTDLDNYGQVTKTYLFISVSDVVNMPHFLLQLINRSFNFVADVLDTEDVTQWL